MKLTVVTGKQSTSVNLRSRSDEHKRSARDCDCKNNEIAIYLIRLE